MPLVQRPLVGRFLARASRPDGALRDPAPNLVDVLRRQRVGVLRHAIGTIFRRDPEIDFVGLERAAQDGRLGIAARLSQSSHVEPQSAAVPLGPVTFHAVSFEDGLDVGGKAHRLGQQRFGVGRAGRVVIRHFVALVHRRRRRRAGVVPGLRRCGGCWGRFVLRNRNPVLDGANRKTTAVIKQATDRATQDATDARRLKFAIRSIHSWIRPNR